MGEQIEKNEVGGSCSTYGKSCGEPEGKRTLGRPRHRWEDNIKMDLQEVGCEGMDWISVGTLWALVNAGNEPSVFIKCREFLD